MIEAYLVVGGIYFAICLIGYIVNGDSAFAHDRRLFARALLATPVWPVGLGVVLYFGIRRVLKDAL